MGGGVVERFMEWLAARKLGDPDRHRRAAEQIVACAGGGRVEPKHIDEALRQAARAPVGEQAQLHKTGQLLLQYLREPTPAPAPSAPAPPPAAPPPPRPSPVVEKLSRIVDIVRQSDARGLVVLGVCALLFVTFILIALAAGLGGGEWLLAVVFVGFSAALWFVMRYLLRSAEAARAALATAPLPGAPDASVELVTYFKNGWAYGPYGGGRLIVSAAKLSFAADSRTDELFGKDDESGDYRFEFARAPIRRMRLSSMGGKLDVFSDAGKERFGVAMGGGPKLAEALAQHGWPIEVH